MDYMKNAVLQREALRYETGDQKLDLLSRIQRFKLPADFLIQRADRIKTITREDLNLVGQALFQQPFTIVIVGDATQVRPQIETLGIPVIETTVDEFIW